VVNALGQPAEIQVGVGYREVQRQFSLSKTEQYISDWLRGELVNVEPTENGELVIKSVAQPTFTRDSIAYKSDGSQVAENQPRFDVIDGVMGLMVEEGTTNVIWHTSDGKFGFSYDGEFFVAFLWDRNDYTNDIEEWITDSSVPSPALHVKRITPYPADGGCAYAVVGNLLVGEVMPGQKYTISLWFKGNKQSSSIVALLWLYWCNSNNEIIEPIILDIPFTDNWQRYVFTVTAPDGAYKISTIEVGLESINLNDTYEFYIAGLQLEQKAYATSWTVGTRQPEVITVPTAGVLNPQEGTIECWVYVPEFWKQGISCWRRIWGIGRGSGAGMYILRYNPTNEKMVFGIYNDAGTAQDISVDKPSIGWHFFAAKWSASEMALFIDGVKVGSIANPSLPSSFADTVISIGCRPDYPYDNVNTLIDDLRISNRARTDAEIQTLYQSNQPLPIDENTTYALRFDNSLKVGRGGYRRNKIYLQSLGTCQGSHIEWSAEIPTNTTAKVYTSLDDVNFTEAVNGAAIEGLSEGVSLSDKALTIKQTMTTEDVSITPKFNRLQYSIDGKVYLRG